jgi:dolichol-phosphate mannosyltransferase
MPKTLIVLPAYNERENIRPMVEALFALNIEGLSILVVDDNSPDGTGEIADELSQEYAGHLHVLHRPGKSGLGKAYIDGFMLAIHELDVDYILHMDMDFSHQPKYVPQLIAELEKGYDMVLGSRYALGGGVEESWSPYRKLLSWFANRVYVNLFLDIPVKDATGGFRIWRKETLVGLDLERIRSNGYVWQVEMVYVASKLGYKIGEIPIHFPDRRQGESKMGLGIQVEAALGVFRLLWEHHALTPAMRRTDAYTAAGRVRSS